MSIENENVVDTIINTFNQMNAITHTKYGSPYEVLEVQRVKKPSPKDNEVLVKIYATTVNAGDLFLIKGEPIIARLSSGLLKPKHTIPGGDIAGQVEAIGSNVKQFKPGDEVFGDIYNYGMGAFAEYVSVPENALTLKPVNITYEEAATAPYAVVALQGLRDKGRIQPGQKVLINGASGGVGTFAVQIAKSYGADVTGVCSTRNKDMVRTIGADHVIDYTKEDFTQKEQRYDLILDIVANLPVSDYLRVLNPGGKYVAVAFKMGAMFPRGGEKKAFQLNHKSNIQDLVFMKELIEAGKVKPVIDRTYPLNEVTEAIQYYEEGHPSGKVVITVEHS